MCKQWNKPYKTSTCIYENIPLCTFKIFCCISHTNFLLKLMFTSFCIQIFYRTISLYLFGSVHRHFQETHHTYAMELGNNKVWDYIGDNYVHRLVQNKSDGKLVQVDEGGNPVQDEKMDALNLEVRLE